MPADRNPEPIDPEEVDPVEFFETEDSIDESVENIIGETWDELKDGAARLRKVQLFKALRLWITEGYVVVPDDYMER